MNEEVLYRQPPKYIFTGVTAVLQNTQFEAGKGFRALRQIK